MRSLPRLAPQTKALAVFLATMLALGFALAWLFWRLLEQDRQLESERMRERLDQAAEHIGAALAAELRGFDRWLAAAGDARGESPPDGLLLLVRADHGLETRPRGRLLYLPPCGVDEKAPGNLFAAGESLEFQQRDPAAAAEFFRRLVGSPRPEIRAGALLRLARNLRKAGKNDDALAAYAALGRLPDVTIEGVPAGLIAINARCRVLESLGRSDELRKERC